jgi:hypothetical protein
MDYLFLLAAVLAAIYGYTFALWLGKNGNKVGAIGVFVLIVISLALPIYRIIIAG